jgi:hypothetical protein
MVVGTLLSPLSVLTSCSDWSDHYDNASGGSNGNSLFEEIASRAEISDFSEVLQNTRVFRQHKVTSTTYAELLSGGSSLTVLAPKNGTFNKDSLLAVLQTAKGDSAVEHFFVKNHLVRSPHSAVDSRLISLNGKYIDFSSAEIGGVPVGESNIQTRNGVLHVLEAPVEYRKTLYETLVLEDEFKGIGACIEAYNEDYFDENSSVSSGIVDGVPVYVDSVIIERNKMMESIGLLNAEDSVYYMSVPTNEGWNKAWQKAEKYFNFADNVDKRDSLQRYWTARALLDDAIFSRTTQASPNDSVKSRWYDRNTPEYHVFYKPFEPTGLFGKAKGEKKCSNGTLYFYDEWPFSPTETYFKKIEQEGETTWNITDYTNTKCTYTVKPTTDKRVHRGSYIQILPSKTNGPWDMTYKIQDVLSGKYNVHIVTIPKSISIEGAKNLPVKYKVKLNYFGQDGQPIVKDCGAFDSTKGTVEGDIEPDEISNMIVAPDMEFPISLYNQSNYVTITISGNANAKKASTETSEMYLDYIYLEPVNE